MDTCALNASWKWIVARIGMLFVWHVHRKDALTEEREKGPQDDPRPNASGKKTPKERSVCFASAKVPGSGRREETSSMENE